MKTIISILLFLIGIAAVANAQTAPVLGSKLFIAPTESGLHTFLAAEIIKKKLPVTIVMSDADAEYILAGGSIKADDKWYHTIFGGKDKNEGSVQLISIETKTVIWAGEAGDRSLMFGGWRRGGQRKVAERLVSQMKKDLFGRK